MENSIKLDDTTDSIPSTAEEDAAPNEGIPDSPCRQASDGLIMGLGEGVQDTCSNESNEAEGGKQQKGQRKAKAKQNQKKSKASDKAPAAKNTKTTTKKTDTSETAKSKQPQTKVSHGSSSQVSPKSTRSRTAKSTTTIIQTQSQEPPQENSAPPIPTDSDIVDGMRKITHYFALSSRAQSLQALEKHCIVTCKFDQRGESAEQMIRCDMCDVWQHLSCVGLDGLDETAIESIFPWFCDGCKMSVKNMNAVKTEINDLKHQVANLTKLLAENRGPVPKVNKKKSVQDVSINCLVIDEDNESQETGFNQSQTNNESIKAKKCNPQVSDKADSISKLKSENSSLKERLTTMQTFINQLLDEKEHAAEPWLPASHQNRPNKGSSKGQYQNPARSNNMRNNNVQGKRKGKNERNTIQKEPSANSNNVTLVLGDSHVKRLDDSKMPNVKSHGIGGLRSNQVVKRQGQQLSLDVPKAKEVILHVGVNDVATSTPKQIVDNFDDITERIKEKNPDVRITISSIMLRKDKTSLNITILETNMLLKKFCSSHGYDFLEHTNITFRHLCHDGLHLNDQGIKLFTQNIVNHVNLG